MKGYCDGSSSWRSATPTVRISANTSKPSNVQPRFEATSAFHCVRSSDRYQGDAAAVADWLMFSPCGFARLLLPAPFAQKLTPRSPGCNPRPAKRGEGGPSAARAGGGAIRGSLAPHPARAFGARHPLPANCGERADRVHGARGLQTRSKFRQHVFAEQFDGAHGIGGEAHREHQPLGAGGLGGERLRETVAGIAADRKPPREIIEQAELLHQLDVGFARPRAVAAVQFEQRETQRLGDAAPLRVLVADHVAGEEREHSADLGARDVAVLAAVERGDLPNLDVVDGAAGGFRAG